MIADILNKATPAHQWIGEHRFHPVRKWRFDWACVSLMVAIEFHGSVHRQGRHTRGVGFLEDRAKMRKAQLLGWIVLEYQTPRKLADMGPILRDVQRVLELRTKKGENE